MYIYIYMYVYGFQQYQTIRSFVEIIYTGKINTDKAQMSQGNLLKKKVEFYRDILINELRITSYELISLRVAFTARVTSYELF